MDIDNDDLDIDNDDLEDDIDWDHYTKNTQLFNILGTFKAKVVDVKDGDTIHFVMVHNGTMQRFVGRMDHYDTQPLKKEARDDKGFAMKVRLHLHSVLWDKMVTVVSNGFDKYNNLLVEVYIGTTNVNEEMIQLGFGKRGRSNRKQPKES